MATSTASRRQTGSGRPLTPTRSSTSTTRVRNPQYGDPQHGDPQHGPGDSRHAGPARVLTRRNAMLAAAVLGAGGGTAYLLRNVGNHGSPASARQLTCRVSRCRSRRAPTRGSSRPHAAPRGAEGSPPAQDGTRTAARPRRRAHGGAAAGTAARRTGPAGTVRRMLQAKLEPGDAAAPRTYGPTAAMRGLIRAPARPRG